MKTMRAPKMDVVRFTESDVIVASNSTVLDTVTISGLGNGNGSDNYLSYGTTQLDLQDAYAHHVQFGNGFTNNGVNKSLSDLVNEANRVNSETNGIDYLNSNWNQTYNWNASSGRFVYTSSDYSNQ